MGMGESSYKSPKSYKMHKTRRVQAAWCLYDWANSSFPAVILTFVFAAYFTRSVSVNPVEGTAQWGMAISLSAIAIAIISPVLGAIADNNGPRKPWLGVFTVLCIVATGFLWIVEPHPAFVLPGLILLGIANFAFETAVVFYNAMLPEFTPRPLLGRMSGWGWGLGYAGGLVCLGLILLVFICATPAPFGLDRSALEHVRIVGPVAALWYGVFALPLFLFVPDCPSSGVSIGVSIKRGLRQLVQTFWRIRDHKEIMRFLVGRMIYTDGLNTLFAFGGVYAAGTWGMAVDEVILFGIAMSLTAGIGAAGFAWIDDWIGAKRTIIIALFGLIVFGGLIFVVTSKAAFWGLGMGLGIFFGPAQAASRSLMARMAPKELRTEMFGFYALSGKATAFIGPALLGWVTVMANSQRVGMATVLIFFVVGLIIIWPLKEPQETA